MPSKYKSKGIKHPISPHMKYLYTCCVCGYTEVIDLPNRNRFKGYNHRNHCGQQMNFQLVDHREVKRETNWKIYNPYG